MSIYDTQNTDTPESEVPVGADVFEKDPLIAQISNVKRMTVDSGRVRIQDGAIIMSDETGVDRVLIGYLKNSF